MRILIAAGGTGGHIYPAIALVQSIKKRYPDCSILWIGGERELEKKIVEKENVEFVSIDVLPLPRSFSLKWLSFTLKIIISFVQSATIIFRFKPDVLVGVGSFHSYPVALSAFLFGIPIIICEQNVNLSLTNKMLLPFASKIALTFKDSMEHIPYWSRKKAVVTGNPVREKILTCSREEGRRKLGLEKEKFTILFLGGSQGAHHLNKLAVETLYLIQEEKWAENIQFMIIAGEKDYSWIREKTEKINIRGKVFSYLSHIHHALAASDVAISRSGATTISEMTACTLPCILIPYPYATNKHQLKNALFLEREGAAKLITQEKVNPSLLKMTIEQIFFSNEVRDKMEKACLALRKPEAAENLTSLILQLEKN
ncbi:undecaprenyldiphospho-muramoylpentapeptide beta-N-acetylglucosaminyltransferase [Candidatus Aerophobetes bacterium]|nr:undecaprenyldiphospho-muramoylpentapeptide beta-N-acetylglucosaminyltransferase [Candidatus Aerophobetes bacterium]